MKLNINNEYDKLLKVLLAPVDYKYLPQQEEFIKILKKYDVEIFMSDKCDNAKYQMFIRDPFIVVKDKILISNMKDVNRQKEVTSINGVLSQIEDDKKIYLDSDVFLEGGDVIIHNDIIFVGQNGNRTNEEGVKFLKETFGNDYKVIPLFMINPSKYIPLVHLDCLFNPISLDTAILYKEGFSKESQEKIESIFPNIIYVDSREQSELATNVFSLGSRTVIVQKRHMRIIKILEEYGFLVEVMNIYDTVLDTGYSRCLTCPLERKC